MWIYTHHALCNNDGMFNSDKKELRVRTSVAALSAMVIVVVSFGGGFIAANRANAQQSDQAIGVPAPDGVDFSPVWKAWQVLDQKFVPAAVATSTPVSTSTKELEQQRVWGMIEGMAASENDPYTFFMPPQQAQEFSDDMSGSFEGVGMQIEIRDQVLTVVSPLKGTPSEKAGIKAGDLILKIDGVSTKDMTVNTAVSKIRGPHGTDVKLTVSRVGWDQPKEITVTRDVINMPTVTTTARDDGVYVIAVTTFTSQAPELFRDALRKFIDSGDSKLVLDLRGNPGGYLDAAVDMASWFVPAGKPIVTEDYAGHRDNIVHRSFGYDVFNKNLHMVILVDKGSASASEIFADALRYYGVAKLVGETTFGKGSVQELVDITPDTSLKVTVARWLGPDNIQIPHTGIIPDIIATSSDKTSTSTSATSTDSQLEAAVRILKAQ